MSYLGCAGCGKTVETSMDENYNKQLPPNWTRKSSDYHTTFCFCEKCSKDNQKKMNLPKKPEKKKIPPIEKIPIGNNIHFSASAAMEAVTWNKCCDVWNKYHNEVIEKLANEGEILDTLYNFFKETEIWEKMNGRVDLIPLTKYLSKHIKENK